MANAIMIQGTASNSGKSLTVTGLCRIFHQDGYSVAPFKSQNMALNSFITREGLEMGRAQVAQAEAAGIEPSVLMNPILLKPTGDATSQVIVGGEVTGTMGAADYFRHKVNLIPAVRHAYETLAASHDIVVIEGAGSPAEINLRENDIVNMGMAAMANAPVILVGDIDRGGVFASLYGTVSLLQPEERARIKGLLINKFRGDPAILQPGLEQLESFTGIPVVGVVPWLRVEIDDEDSVSPRLSVTGVSKTIDIAVIRLPRLSNFTDFNALDRHPALGVRYVDSVRTLGDPDLIIIPGTKNTMADLLWLRQNGLEALVKKAVRSGTPLIGVCGGFQMLGMAVHDPDRVEHGGSLRGLELLPVETEFAPAKTRTRVTGTVGEIDGFFSCLSGAAIGGYEIHMGQSRITGEAIPFANVRNEDDPGLTDVADGALTANIFGSYVHGLFDNSELTNRLAAGLCRRKGVDVSEGLTHDARRFRESQYDILADGMRQAINMDALYRMMGIDR